MSLLRSSVNIERVDLATIALGLSVLGFIFAQRNMAESVAMRVSILVLAAFVASALMAVVSSLDHTKQRLKQWVVAFVVLFFIFGIGTASFGWSSDYLTASPLAAAIGGTFVTSVLAVVVFAVGIGLRSLIGLQTERRSDEQIRKDVLSDSDYENQEL